MEPLTEASQNNLLKKQENRYTKGIILVFLYGHYPIFNRAGDWISFACDHYVPFDGWLFFLTNTP